MKKELQPCILPWINFNTNPFGRSRPCGYSQFKSDIKVQDSSITEEFNNEIFKNVRKDFLNGQWPANCQKCEYIEKHNPGNSKKSDEDFFYKQNEHLIAQTKNDGSVDYFPTQIDIRLGTLCNLKCIHCGTGNSSKWLEDKDLIGKYQNTELIHYNNSWVDHENKMWRDVYAHLNTIEKFNILGGEPFASKQHSLLLDKICENKRAEFVTLQYVTNGTLITPKHIEQFQKFKHVTVNVSFDAAGSVLEFFRFPIKIQKLYDNLQLLDQAMPKHFDIGLQWTSSNISLYYLPESIDFFEKHLKNFKFKFENFVVRPQQMSPQNLPKPVKKKISERLAAYIDRYPQIEFYLKHMNEQELWSDFGPIFMAYLNDLSAARNIQYMKYIPELISDIEASDAI